MESWELLNKIIDQNLAAETAFDSLTGYGANVYLVGKALRDSLQGKEPKQLDLLVTGVTQEDIESALSIQGAHLNSTQNGYNFRFDNYNVNIDLPRVSGIVDPRIPIEVYLGEQDHSAAAIAYDLSTGQFIDPYSGLSDAANGVLRPTQANSYADSPDHILNGIALHGEGYLPDSSFVEAITNHGHGIKDLSPDQLRVSLDRILRSDDPVRALNLMKETGILEYLLPEVANTMGFDQNNQFHDLELGDHLMEALRQMVTLSDDPDLRLAALLHDIGKPDSYWEDEQGHGHYYQDPETGQGMDHDKVGAEMARNFMERLNYPENRIKRVEKLIQLHMQPWWSSEKGARKFYNTLGGDQDMANDWVKLRSSDMRGKTNGQMDPQDEQQHQLSFELLNQVIDKQNATNAPSLEISGYDLMDAGIPQGPEVGRVLSELQEAVDRDPSLNNRETLLDLARQYA